MSEAEFQELLEVALKFAEVEFGLDLEVTSFDLAGLLTHDRGLVVRVDGSVFHLKIARGD